MIILLRVCFCLSTVNYIMDFTQVDEVLIILLEYPFASRVTKASIYWTGLLET